MKRPVVIFRFGASNVVPADVQAMQILTEGTMLAMGCDTPFGIASVVITDKTHAQILDIFKEAEAQFDDNLPVMVFDYGDAQIHCPFGGIEGMLSCVDQFVEEHSGDLYSKQVIKLNLDDILDKISNSGMASLTREEFNFLQKSSNL